MFRSGQEPFVAPSGGRLDDIIRAVRDCPSGALGFAIDGAEARSQTNWDNSREPAIEISRDGPYRITGGIALTDAGAGPVSRNAGASLEHYALCRCGQSQNKPFCSGMHWYVGFTDPPPAAEPTVFEWAGGLPALTRMTRLLYEKHVPGDPELCAAFAAIPPGYAEREAARMAEIFGGPVGGGRAGGGDGEAAGGRAGNDGGPVGGGRAGGGAGQAATEAGLPADPAFRAALAAYLEWDSRDAMTAAAAGPGQPPASRPVPRWDWTAAGPPDTAAASVGDGQDGQDADVPLPAPGEAVGFATHIRPLFRGKDRRSMSFAFDLWSLDDVRAHAAGILERLRNGSMPCDGAWPQDRIEVFQRWTESGQQK